MSDALLTLIVPEHLAQQLEDLLLEHSHLASGFTASLAHGHGAGVTLLSPSELVSGHAPRRRIETAGQEETLRELLVCIKHKLPHANIYYWLLPVSAVGHL